MCWNSQGPPGDSFMPNRFVPSLSRHELQQKAQLAFVQHASQDLQQASQGCF